MIDVVLLLLALLLCLLLSFFFSGSETAIISVNTYRLRSMHEQGDASAGKLLNLLANTQRLLVMVLIGNGLAGVVAALLFEQFLKRLWPELVDRRLLGGIQWGDLLDIAVLTPIIIIFAEILPKTLFRQHANRVMGYIRPLIVVWLVLFKPIILVVERFTHLVLSPLSVQRTRALRQVTRQDVINLISPDAESDESEAATHPDGSPAPEPAPATREAAGEGEPDEASDERRMIHNIIQLQETRAYEIMTPLVDLVAIQLGQMELDEVKRLARKTGYSRFPVYHERIVNMIGYLDIFRVLREDDGTRTLEDFIERAHYVPETKRVDDLLQEFLQLRIKNAIVVNEYGGCSGWISREDMLEEIVGELEDELDEPNRAIRECTDGSFVVEGRVEIDRLNEALDAEFSDEDWETLAGLIMAEMGRIPAVGDEVVIDGWRATVVKMTGHRLELVRLAPVKD